MGDFKVFSLRDCTLPPLSLYVQPTLQRSDSLTPSSSEPAALCLLWSFWSCSLFKGCFVIFFQATGGWWNPRDPYFHFPSGRLSKGRFARDVLCHRTKNGDWCVFRLLLIVSLDTFWGIPRPRHRRAVLTKGVRGGWNSLGPCILLGSYPQRGDFVRSSSFEIALIQRYS